MKKVLRLLAWQTPCLHSDILSKSPGAVPLAHLPRALQEWPEWHGVNILAQVLRSRVEGVAGYCSTL